MNNFVLVPTNSDGKTRLLYNGNEVCELTLDDLVNLRTQVNASIEYHADSVRWVRFPGFEYLDSISDSDTIWVVSLTTGKQYKAVRSPTGYILLINTHRGNFRGAWPVVSKCAPDNLYETLKNLDSE